MSRPTPELLAERTFATHDLMQAHPPVWKDKNKQALYAYSTPEGAHHEGELYYSRWRALPLPSLFAVKGDIHFEAREDIFGYEPLPEGDTTIEWYLNFAHQRLFIAYKSSLMAQDEMQVAEHPALGSLREVLVHDGEEPLTVEDGVATPVLIMGVERRCSIDTTPCPEREGRLYGLYGHRFGRASQEAVLDATTPLTPPTRSNILAMEAPPVLRGGLYKPEEISFIFQTAWSGFSAARTLSERRGAEGAKVVIHTGFWGCGAYGGSRELMALLQLLAARFTGVDGLVFHTFDHAGMEDYEDALEVYHTLVPVREDEIECQVLLDKIAKMKFAWGESDGN